MKADHAPSPLGASTGIKQAALALFAFIFFARAWLIKVWGSPVPYWDEWDAQALGLIRPWLDGTLRWADLFAPHNEHRIVLTRLVDLALFIASGKWNIWWQLLLNAALHAAAATTLVCLCWNDLTRLARPLWMAGVALLFIVPAGWQNALWGFQSQVYFCTLLSVLALGGLLLAEPLKLRWWLGWVAALLALFSLGSGLLAALTALSLGALTLGARYFSDRKIPSISSVFPLFAIMLVVVLGWSMRVEVPQHATLRAHSVAQFGAVFFRCLSWPWVNSVWMWVVLQAPLGWMVFRLIRRRSTPNHMESFILGLGLLAVAHAAAVAYTRGAGLFEARPLSRYQDQLLCGVAANFVVLLKFAGENRPRRVAALLWAGSLLAGLLTLTTTNLSLNLPVKRHQDAISLRQVRAYLATNNAAVFAPQQSLAALHPNAAVVQQVLDDHQVRHVLPREFFEEQVRPPLLVENSPWLTLLSIIGLMLAAIKCGRLVKT